MKLIFSVLLMLFLISACTIGKSFTTRKYMPGHYITWHKGKVKEKSHDKAPLVRAKKTEAIPVEVVASQKENDKIISIVSTEPKKVKAQPKNLQEIVQLTKKLTWNGPVMSLVSKAQKDTPPLTEKRDQAPSGTKPLLSVIFGGLGIVFDVLGFMIALILTDYIFIVFSVIGISLGIAAIILGIQSLQDYKTEKANGNRHTTWMVLGIVGTSVGGVAILAGIFYAFIGAIFVSAI